MAGVRKLEDVTHAAMYAEAVNHLWQAMILLESGPYHPNSHLQHDRMVARVLVGEAYDKMQAVRESMTPQPSVSGSGVKRGNDAGLADARPALDEGTTELARLGKVVGENYRKMVDELERK